MCSVAEFPYVVFWIHLNVSNDRPCAGRMCLPQNWHQSQIMLYEHVSQRNEGQGCSALKAHASTVDNAIPTGEHTQF